MRHTLKMPKLGDTTSKVVVSEWYAAVGDAVVAGEPLLRVETDKVEVDVSCPVSGILVELLAAPDDTIGTGAAYAVVED